MWTRGYFALSFLFLSFSVNIEAYIQLLELSDGTIANKSISNGVILTKDSSKIDCILSRTLSAGVRGMWQVSDGTPGRTDFRSWTTVNDDLEQEDLDPLWHNIREVRRMGPSDLTLESLTLYEGHLYGEYPFPKEHFFTEDSWTGEPFPLNWMVYTGRSNWTIFEGSNFTGAQLCLRAWNLFDQSEADDPPYPKVVGSVLRGCIDGVNTN